MKPDQIQTLEKVQKIEGVDVFDIQQKDGKTFIKLYPAKATEETKTIILDNGDEQPINVSDEPVRQVPDTTFKFKDNDMSQFEQEYRTDEEVVWNAVKEKIRGVFK